MVAAVACHFVRRTHSQNTMVLLFWGVKWAGCLLGLLFGGLAFAEQMYTCPMHPHYIATEPGACPICGMDLTLVRQSESMPSTPASAPGQPSVQKNKPGPQRQSILISPETIQNMGVRVEAAETSLFGASIRSYGVIQANTRLSKTISGRVAGWVESLEIKAVGDEVQPGDLLFTLYSPDLASAQQDYVSALRSGVVGRIQAAKRRLMALGVGPKTLGKLESTRTVFRNVPFYYEPAKPNQSSAVVSELSVQQGAYVQSGQTIATLQSYASVWVNVSVAEKDLGFIQANTLARVTLPNVGGLLRLTQVDYIHPTIDTASRTGQVRLVLENEDGRLKPGAYADVVFETQVQNRLSVPSEAILKSAEGDYVVLAQGDGRFQPQAVRVGVESNGRSEVLSGVVAGGQVVVSGQFLLDSESSLRESFRKLQRMQQPLDEISLSPDQQAMLDHLVDAAIYLHERLMHDKPVQGHMLAPALKMIDHLLPSLSGTQVSHILTDSKQAIIAAQTALTQSQVQTALATLSASLKPWVQAQASYYETKGVRLFLDHVSDLYWFQLGLTAQPMHPYGGGHAVSVPLEATSVTTGDASGNQARPK